MNLQHATAKSIWNLVPEQLLSLVSDQGIVITRKTKEALSSLRAAGFVALELPSETILAVRTQKMTGLEGKEVLIVVSRFTRIVLLWT